MSASSWLSLRNSFSEDRANPLENESRCGAASRGTFDEEAKCAVLFQICKLGYFGAIRESILTRRSNSLILRELKTTGSMPGAHVP
ncbi:hypothetical protein ACFQ3P_36575 [Paraburkholderia sabiae]|uniref:Uncharacterized protein n=1 Tax=Paraburkholderia sabiae TaxID=273251 RepID=A0ABU9QNS8_9BURK|nr:hypothetical protein [Paraburkholderia sabiae]WJZ72954.1 hypothetical protein QEN71_22780 [Paraburkholderia sabiae]